MHDCLRISEILRLIFGFVTSTWELDRPTLASLARTCRLFSSPALDVLWRDLPKFKPLLDVFPITASSVDDMRWLTFRKYAVRVKIVHGIEEHVLQAKEAFISAVQHCPPAYLPLLPNLTELDWMGWGGFGSVFSVLRHFASPTVTTITLRPMSGIACPSAAWDALMDLPRVCPNVTSFTMTTTRNGQDHDFSQEVTRMVTQWPRLQTLRTCPLPQSVMDQLFSQQPLEALTIICDKSPPIYSGRIPDSVRELTLFTGPVICTRFLETTYASPTKFALVIDVDFMQEDRQGAVMDMCCLLPHRLNTSRLLSLTIQLDTRTFHMPLDPLMPVIFEFTALRELDLDQLSTVQMTNMEFARVARSFPHLRSLRLCTRTTSPYISELRPAASVEAVIAVLTFCEHLEKLHIMFNGYISPPAPLGELTSQGWGVSNKRIAKLHVGHSPIEMDKLRTCLKSIMPCLVSVMSHAYCWYM